MKQQCPKCGSDNINFQRETISSTTTMKHYSKHGLFYYLFVWWWIWIFKLMWGAIKFIFTLGLSFFLRKKKEVGSSVGKTINNNKTIAVCQNCGNSWEIK